MGYIQLNENPHGILVDDCVIRAIATATGRSWDDVYLDLMIEGYEHKNWGNFNAIWWNYLIKKGYKRFLIPDTCPMCYTLKDFVKEHPHGVYIVGDGRHTVAVVNSYYMDTFNSGNMSVLYYFTKI